MRCICLVDGICYTACEYGVVFFYGLKQKFAYMVHSKGMDKPIMSRCGKNRGSIGLFYMLWKKIITWHIPVSILGSVFAITGILYLVDSSSYVNPLYHLASGGLLLGAIFMATDYVTSPMSAKGQIIYGVCIGVLTVVIRNWGSYPEGMSFAILIMNAFTPLINNYVKPKRFGEVVKK